MINKRNLTNFDMNSDSILDLFSKDMKDLLQVDDERKIKPDALGMNLKSHQCCLYHLQKLSYDEEYPRREAFENVLLSLDNEAFNFVYILKGTQNGIELYLGVVENEKENTSILGSQLKAVNYGDNIAEVFNGNFNGSELEKVTGENFNRILFQEPLCYDYAGIVTGVPSVDENTGEKQYDL